MSQIPYTSLVMNPEGLETATGRVPDIIYLMAPAIKGGEVRDEYGIPVVDSNGNAQMRQKIFGTRYTFEKEFGRAQDGSPASVYASWIYDRGEFAIRCRRVVGPTLSYATGGVKDAEGDTILNIRSLTQSQDANNIRIDIDASTNRELYLYKPNTIWDTQLGVLQTQAVYGPQNRIIFAGKRLSDNVEFKLAFFGDSSTQAFELFNFGRINPAYPFSITDGVTTFAYAGDNTAPQAGQYGYDAATKQLTFGSAPVSGNSNLLISVQCPFGVADLMLSGDAATTVFDLDFPAASIDMQAFMVDGMGSQYDQRFTKLVRLYTTSQFISMRGVTASLIPGTNIGTVKLSLVSGVGANMKTETYDNLATLRDIISQLSNRSAICAAEALVQNLNQLPALFSNAAFQAIGVMMTVRNGNDVEQFDDIRNAVHAAQVINDGTLGSKMISVSLVNGQNFEIPAFADSIELAGGNSGLNPTTADYLDALAESSGLLDVTIMIAPGVSDDAFHALMKTSCEQASAKGNYRMCFVGGILGESIDEKIKRTRVINSERIAIIGDGLYLIDPQTALRKLYSPAVAVAPFVGQLVSVPYYTSQTYKYITNAYGIEHEYDNAQHEELHQHRLITFQINNGVQIIDGITTSTYNAYEDIHLIRIYDVIARIVNSAMKKAIGRSNVPPTWAFVFGIIRRMLDTLKDTMVIMEYKILNETKPQDLVDRRFRLRISIVPVFPIKYVEGYIDLIPPTYVPGE